MEMFDGVTTVIGLTGIASVWYFGIGAKRASHALRAELQRPKPWNNSGSSEQAYKLRELELRRTRRNRMLFAALSGGGVFLTVFLQDAVNRRMPHHNDVAAVVRPQLPPNLTNEGAMILIFLQRHGRLELLHALSVVDFARIDVALGIDRQARAPSGTGRPGGPNGRRCRPPGRRCGAGCDDVVLAVVVQQVRSGWRRAKLRPHTEPLPRVGFS